MNTEKEWQLDKREIRKSVIKNRETSALRNMYGHIKHLNNRIKHPISGNANLGSSESDPISV